MSSVSMEKLASKVQEAEAPEVASKARHHIGHSHHGVDHHHGDQQQASHWSGRTSPSNSGVGEPRYVLPSTAKSLSLQESFGWRLQGLPRAFLGARCGG